MSDSSTPDALAVELRRERSIRRTLKLLEVKRNQMRADLRQFVTHLTLLLPNKPVKSDPKLLTEAIERLGDDAFAQLLTQILQEHPPD